MYQDYITQQDCNFLWDKINEIGSYIEIEFSFILDGEGEDFLDWLESTHIVQDLRRFP